MPKRYEYKTVMTDLPEGRQPTDEEATILFNVYGQDGWQIISIHGTATAFRLWMMRELDD